MNNKVMLSKNFSRIELACRCGCDTCEIKPEIVTVIQEIRDQLGKPLFVSSGYRCANHPVEAMKPQGPGEHNSGHAVDIICHGQVALFVLGAALHLGVTRVGIHQKGRGSDRYIHLGVGDKYDLKFKPGALWTY